MGHPASTVAQGETPGRARRWAFHLTILVVLTAAFVTSFKAGSHGAYLLGFPPEFLFTAPLICDIVAGLATLVHGWARDDEQMRTLATKFVMGPMVLSWAANSVDHLERAQPETTWPAAGQWAWIVAVIVFAGLCPVSVASLLFFSTKFREFERRTTGQDVAVKSEITATTDETVAVSCNVEDEPEFVEPAPVVSRVAAALPLAEIEPEDTLNDELDELLEIERVIAEEKAKGYTVRREIAEIMVREKVSRATAHRRRKDRANAALA